MSLSRSAGSLRVPWAVGLVSLLVAGFAIAVLPLGGRSSAVSAQKPGVREVAVQVADSAAERVNALTTRLQLTAPGVTDRTGLDQLRTDTSASGLLLVRGKDRLTSGTAPAAPSSRPATVTVDAVDGRIVLTVPLATSGVLVGSFDGSAVLGTAGPVWLVSSQGGVLASSRAPARPDARFHSLAVAAAAGRPGAQATADDVLAAAAPVPASALPAGAPDPGWSVLLTRAAQPVVPIRGPRIALAVAVLLVVLLVFGWLEIRMLRRLRGLHVAVDRVVRGDLDTPVELGRHDELGHVARGIERLRVRLVRESVSLER